MSFAFPFGGLTDDGQTASKIDRRMDGHGETSIPPTTSLRGVLLPKYHNLSSVSQNVLKFYQQLTGEERRIPFIFDDFHFCRSRVIEFDLTENRMFTLW
jgi:hypothetical protein